MNSSELSYWVRESNRMRPPSGESANVIARGVCQQLCTMPRVQVAHAFFPSDAREAIEDLACHAPASVGWKVTHWSQRSLAQAAGELEYVDRIHPTTVRDIL